MTLVIGRANKSFYVPESFSNSLVPEWKVLAVALCQKFNPHNAIPAAALTKRVDANDNNDYDESDDELKRFAIRNVYAQLQVMMTMYLPGKEFLMGERCHYSPQ